MAHGYDARLCQKSSALAISQPPGAGGGGGIYVVSTDRDVPLIWYVFSVIWYEYGSVILVASPLHFIKWYSYGQSFYIRLKTSSDRPRTSFRIGYRILYYQLPFSYFLVFSTVLRLYYRVMSKCIPICVHRQHTQH